MSFEIGLRPDALSFWANDNTVTTSRRHRRETEAEAPGDGVDLSPTANGDLDGRRIDPEAIHITQFRNSRYNPQGLSRSFDCGPTSLAMALRALGLQAPGVGSDFQNSDQGEIDAARYAMFSNSDGRTVDAARDGITGARNADGSFARDKGEHQTTSTWVDDIKRGARNSGAETYAVHSTQDIADAVSKGDPVVLAGDPRRNGSYGDKYNIGYSGRGDHFITVSGYDPATRTFTINDPLSRRGPLQVTWEQLDTFRDKGVALHRTGGRQREQVPTPANDPTPDTNPTGEPDRHHHRRHVEHPHHQTDRKEETIGQTGKQEASPADTDHTDNGIGDQIRTVAENIIEGGDQDQVEHLLRLLSFAQARGIEISARTDELVERALNKKMEGDSGHGWFVSIAV